MIEAARIFRSIASFALAAILAGMIGSGCARMQRDRGKTCPLPQMSNCPTMPCATGACPEKIFNIIHYGAVADGRTTSTAAVQNAIDACTAAGGGRVVVPTGEYLIGPIVLKDNVTLHLETGAALLGSKKMEDYRIKSLVYAEGAKNIAITGFGVINGQGEIFWRGKKQPLVRPSQLVNLVRCQNVRVQGVTLTDSPNWTLRVDRCDWVFIDGIKIVNSHDAPNTDGIDPVSCSNVVISNCYIDTGDDAICPKSEDKDKPCENLVVTNCVLISDDSAIKCGTSSRGVIRHCAFSNIVIRDTKYGIGFYMKDGGSYEDIQFSNIDIETTHFADKAGQSKGVYGIFMDIEPRDAQSPLGTIRNIVFRDIAITTQNGNCLIQGRDDKLIEDVTLDNVRMRVLSRIDYTGRSKPRGNRNVKGKAPNDFAYVPAHFVIANVKGLTIRDLSVRDEVASADFERQALWGYHLEDVSLDGLRLNQKVANAKLPILNFKDCGNVLIRGFQAPPVQAPSVRFEGTETSRVTIMSNDFSAAVNPVEIAKEIKLGAIDQSSNRMPGKK